MRACKRGSFYILVACSGYKVAKHIYIETFHSFTLRAHRYSYIYRTLATCMLLTVEKMASYL